MQDVFLNIHLINAVAVGAAMGAAMVVVGSMIIMMVHLFSDKKPEPEKLGTLKLHTDPSTGMQYVSGGGALTPRLDAYGNQMSAYTPAPVNPPKSR